MFLKDSARRDELTPIHLFLFKRIFSQYVVHVVKGERKKNACVFLFSTSKEMSRCAQLSVPGLPAAVCSVPARALPLYSTIIRIYRNVTR